MSQFGNGEEAALVSYWRKSENDTWRPQTLAAGLRARMAAGAEVGECREHELLRQTQLGLPLVKQG